MESQRHRGYWSLDYAIQRLKIVSLGMIGLIAPTIMIKHLSTATPCHSVSRVFQKEKLKNSVPRISLIWFIELQLFSATYNAMNKDLKKEETGENRRYIDI